MVTDIVDAHHHLWDLGAVHYPWLMETGVRRFFGDPTPIQKNYLASDLQNDVGELPVTRSVHIQVGAAEDQAVTETRWLQSIADDPNGPGFPNAIVAFCDLSGDDAMAQLDAQRQFGNVRGVRQIVGRSAEEDASTGSGALLDHPVWRSNLGRLPKLDLSFDLQLIPPQMPAAIAILDTVPDLNVALCHCGSPWDRTPEGLKFWRTQIAALAERPNTVCKLSGFGMFDHEWNASRVRDIVLTVIDAFGPNRCMFGSNFPVDKLYRDYQSVYANYFELLQEFDRHERSAMLSETARRFYRLE